MTLESLYYLGKMWRNPFKSQKEIEALQLKMTKAAVQYAYENTPFYHDKLKKAGVHPRDITSLRDMSKIPFTTKDEIRKAGNNAVVRNISMKECCYATTSGSTGRKLEILRFKNFEWRVHAVFYRIYLNWGMRPFKRVTYIRFKPLREDITEKWRIFTPYYISTFLDINEQFDQLVSQKPHILVGHPPDLINMGRMARSRGETLTFDFIGSNSEIITEKEKKFLEETFHCPVYEEYSSIEAGFIAQNCRKKRMHTISDSVFAEVVKDDEVAAPGERGEVVVTPLFKNATPFIRYRQEDIASFSDESCDCGINFPLINVIEGRKDDLIVLPSGKEIAPTRLVPLFFDLKIQDFSIVQVSPDRVVIQIVPQEEFDQKEEEALLELVRDELQGLDVSIVRVGAIEKSVRGKRRAVMNLEKKGEE